MTHTQHLQETIKILELLEQKSIDLDAREARLDKKAELIHQQETSFINRELALNKTKSEVEVAKNKLETKLAEIEEQQRNLVINENKLSEQRKQTQAEQERLDDKILELATLTEQQKELSLRATELRDQYQTKELELVKRESLVKKYNDTATDRLTAIKLKEKEVNRRAQKIAKMLESVE